MELIIAIKDNFFSGILYWSVFLISILLSSIYQKIRINYNNGIQNIKKMPKSLNVIWTILIIIGPALLIGFREISVGADTQNIVNSYMKVAYVTSFKDTISDFIGTGFVYAAIRYLSYHISNGNPTFYLTVLSFLSLFIFFRGLDKWIGKISLPLSLFIYYAFFAMQLLNQSRQMLALSVMFYALFYLLNRKHFKYFLLIVISMLIHYTAILGLIFPLFYFKRTYLYPVKKWLFYFFIIMSPLILYPILTLISYIIPSSYSHYLTTINFEGFGLGLILNTAPIILPVLIFKRYLTREKNEMLVRISLLSFPARLSGYFSYYVMRMYYYGAVAIVLLIPIILGKIKNQTLKKVVLIGSILFFSLYYIVNYMYLDIANMFPYQSILNR